MKLEVKIWTIHGLDWPAALPQARLSIRIIRVRLTDFGRLTLRATLKIRNKVVARTSGEIRLNRLVVRFGNGPILKQI